MKILMLTTVYISEDIKILNNTAVCHYFAKEWVLNGHDVKVVYSYPVFLRIFHWLAFVLRTQITRISNSSIRIKRISKDKSFEIDGVYVLRAPIFKPIPLGRYPNKSITRQIDKVLKSNLESSFIPDIIVGHFHNPNLELLSILKDKYRVPTCLVLHGGAKDIAKLYKSNFDILLANIDVWGYRSRAIQTNFESLFGVRSKSFLCYSGIPASYLKDFETVYSKKLPNSFVFVGSLIKRKHPASLIEAIPKSNIVNNYLINYVGDGYEKKSIELKIKGRNLSSKVKFWGKLPRDKVQDVMQSSEYFIMISENESFGLVYIEAMAKGCITIASKKEGMDGIIIHGVNGFLCEAGNDKELERLINYISTLSKKQRIAIIKNAILTANSYSDYNAANNYIDSIINFNGHEGNL